MDIIKSAVKWLLLSSKDATRVSATVKFALLASIPMALQAAGLTCTFFQAFCAAPPASDLEAVAVGVGTVVYFALSLVASLGVLFGASRKVFTTVAGTNDVINSGI